MSTERSVSERRGAPGGGRGTRATGAVGTAWAVGSLTVRARAEVEAKLGRCSRCMRASLLSAMGSTGLLLGIAAVGLHPLAVGAAAVVALALIALVLAHAAAYIYHATHPAPASLGRPCCGQARRDPQRAVPQPLVQFQRRPLVPVLLSLPTAFGITGGTQLAWVARAAAQTPPLGTTTVTRTFSTTLPCPPCDGECSFGADFEYDFVDRPASQGGGIQVTRFKMTWNQDDTEACVASIDRGMGAFDFQCAPTPADPSPKVCKLTGGNIWQCACDTRIEFVRLPNAGPEEDCICPNEKNRTAYAHGVCGAPIAVEKSCTFAWIDINFRHKVTCSCPSGGITRGDLVVVVQYRNGVITFDGNIQPLPTANQRPQP